MSITRNDLLKFKEIDDKAYQIATYIAKGCKPEERNCDADHVIDIDCSIVRVKINWWWAYGYDSESSSFSTDLLLSDDWKPLADKIIQDYLQAEQDKKDKEINRQKEEELAKLKQLQEKYKNM